MSKYFIEELMMTIAREQKQRIAIARVFLKNAPILLLDEATSSLDSMTENEIQETLNQVMLGKTTLVIAHRLATLKKMDRILVFDQGKIIEDGPLQLLLQNKGGIFYKLWQMQAIRFKDKQQFSLNCLSTST